MVENLASAVTTAVTDVEMKQRAATVGEKIRAEDGIAAAIQVIESLHAQQQKMIRSIAY